ncbi:MAG TPA: PEGA domain-containing protein [Vicinamibacterales bacterium]|nr:PEGA domain-containing protein [Vicinamibacterales bacterium]
METRTEVVVAAEALRTWVHAQRASWAAPEPVRNARSSERRVESADATAARPMTAPAPPVSAPAHPVQPATPAVAPPPAIATIAIHASAPVVAERSTVDRPLPLARHVTIETPPAWYSRSMVRVAVAAIVLVALAAGALVLGRRETAPRVGTATFDSAPPGAQVFVDGKPAGTTPLRLELNPGAHAVEFKLKEATRTQTIEIARGRELAVQVEWNPRRVGGLQVSTTPPGAKVLIDGRERGQTPLTLTDVAVGSHTVVIESSEGSVRRRVAVADGKTEILTESIYPGWLHVSSPIDVSVMDGSNPVLLDDSNRVLLKPGVHNIRIENRALEFSQPKQVEIEPGGTTRVAIDVPTSTLTVTGSTGAEVFIDGTKAGETPLVDFQVQLGTRDIMLVDKSGVTRHASITMTTKPAQLDIPFGRP